jgi:hypothetical protein
MFCSGGIYRMRAATAQCASGKMQSQGAQKRAGACAQRGGRHATGAMFDIRLSEN